MLHICYIVRLVSIVYSCRHNPAVILTYSWWQNPSTLVHWYVAGGHWRMFDLCGGRFGWDLYIESSTHFLHLARCEPITCIIWDQYKPQAMKAMNLPEVSKVQVPAVTRLFMMEFLSCLICTSPRWDAWRGRLCGKLWKVFVKESSRRISEDTQKISAIATLRVKIATELTSRISIASSTTG